MYNAAKRTFGDKETIQNIIFVDITSHVCDDVLFY